MRTLYLLTLPALLLGLPAAAQLRLGVKAGLNLSGAGAVTPVGPHNLARLAAGAVGRYPLGTGNVWSLQAELLYSGKGTESEGLGAPAVPLFVHRLSFYEMPLLARVTVRGLALEAGPQLSYLFGSEYRTATDVHYERRGLRLFQVGYAAGLSGDLPDNFFLSLRLARDLTSRLKPAARSYPDHLNYAFQLQLGYLLPAKAV
ncbi:hypothetical protein GCM10027048_20640 [Hymenobacter coalescens]